MNGLKRVIKKFPQYLILSWLFCSLTSSAFATAIGFGDTGPGVNAGLFHQYNEGLGKLGSFFESGGIADFIFVESDDESAPPDVSKHPISADEKGDGNLSTFINFFLLGVIILFLIILTVVFDILGVISGITKKPLVNWNYINAIACILFLILAIIASVWDLMAHGPLTVLAHDAATVHGRELDNLFFVTTILTGIVFVITQIVLFWFAYKYRHKDGHRALFYADNHRLEQIWTLVPAVVLTVLILYGLKTWRNITGPAPEGTPKIEVFAYQFGWAARYPGADDILGNANFNFITTTNALGIAVKGEVLKEVEELEAEIKAVHQQLDDWSGFDAPFDEHKAIKDLDGRIHSEDFTDEIREQYYEAKATLMRRHTQLERIRRTLEANQKNNTMFVNGEDDIITNEVHIPVGTPVEMKFRARDVIHSAYLPYFRVQMNVVPGIPTSFWFEPNITTKDMRIELKNPEFDYYMICAKLCGSAHFNMKMKVVVETMEEYNAWLKLQKPTFMKTVESVPADSSAAKKIATATTIQ